MIGSPEINKVIRQHLSPVLKQHGFARVQTRHNWGWHGACTWVLDLRAVGGYFAQVTGWPAMSVLVSLGVFYDFVPLEVPRAVRLASDGKPLPLEVVCHQRSALHIGVDQQCYTQQLTNPAEQVRTDLWWIEPDGSNVEAVVQDIAHRFLAEGLPWFERMTDLPTAYDEVKKERDGFDKFSRAAYLARHLGRIEEHEHYRAMLEREAQRISWTSSLALYP